MTQEGKENDPKAGFIDANLKRVFEETMQEGVPDRFKELLDQLKKQESQQGEKE